MQTNKHTEAAKLLTDYKQRYLEVLSRYTGDGRRSYGFEYEFLPHRPMDRSDVDTVRGCLTDLGFEDTGKALFSKKTGMTIDFEPGGQIEYCSPPLLPGEKERLDALTMLMRETNKEVRDRTGIEYLALDFLPGRAGAPLCLTSKRYRNLHDRLSRVDSRGLEMMKGTASIHLHVVISNFRNLLPLFNQLCELSVDPNFRMSVNRRDIWDHTDPTRCGRPPCCFADLKGPDELIHRLIGYALNAAVLGEDVPFERSADQSFEAFLDHMTTIFTDVRFNLKGPTLELRTLDSLPISRFREKYELFVDIMENV